MEHQQPQGGGQKKLEWAAGIAEEGPRWSCGACEKNPRERIRRGCTQPAPEAYLPYYSAPASEATDRCPLAVISQDAWRVVEAQSLLDAHGVLPDPGGWCNQAAPFATACAIVGEVRQRIMKAKQCN